MKLGNIASNPADPVPMFLIGDTGTNVAVQSIHEQGDIMRSPRAGRFLRLYRGVDVRVVEKLMRLASTTGGYSGIEPNGMGNTSGSATYSNDS